MGAKLIVFYFGAVGKEFCIAHLELLCAALTAAVVGIFANLEQEVDAMKASSPAAHRQQFCMVHVLWNM